MIEYDKDFQKVMDELQANFGWSNNDVLPESYKDLINDTIRAVKKCDTHDVVLGREELCENPHCEDGIVDYDYYKNPIYCHVCDNHN